MAVKSQIKHVHDQLQTLYKVISYCNQSYIVQNNVKLLW